MGRAGLKAERAAERRARDVERVPVRACRAEDDARRPVEQAPRVDDADVPERVDRGEAVLGVHRDEERAFVVERDPVGSDEPRVRREERDVVGRAVLQADLHDGAEVQVADVKVLLVRVEGDPVGADRVEDERGARSVSDEERVREPDARLAAAAHAPDLTEERIGHVHHAVVVEREVVGPAVRVERGELLDDAGRADPPDERPGGRREARADGVDAAVGADLHAQREHRNGKGSEGRGGAVGGSLLDRRGARPGKEQVAFVIGRDRFGDLSDRRVEGRSLLEPRRAQEAENERDPAEAPNLTMESKTPPFFAPWATENGRIIERAA